MASDHAAGVVVERAGGDDAHLLAFLLPQTVEVVAGGSVAQERAVGNAVPKELGGLGIDLGGIHADIWGTPFVGKASS